MAANINDKITSASSGVRPVNTTVSNIRNSGNTTLSCADLTGWPTASAVHFVTYKLDGTGNIVVGTQSDWKGIVSGVTITDLVLTGGSDNGNAIGDIVVCLPTARYGKELYDALSTEHKLTGAHKDITADSLATDTILEGTPANGVTIDGLNIKDGKLNTNDSVVTSNITDGSVTFAKTTGIWWEELGRTTLGSAGDTITVSSLSQRTYLKVLFSGYATGGTLDTNVRFNNDSGSNYAYYQAASLGTGGAQTSQSGVGFESGATDSGSSSYGQFEIFNIPAREKMFSAFSASGDATGGGTVPSAIQTIGKWANTANPITRIDWINSSGTGDFAIGSEVIVLGHN